MKRILFAAAVLALAPACLLAEEPASPDVRSAHGEEMFKRWDSNGDGVISRDEAQAAGAERIAQKFDALDANKDGQLTQEELRQAHTQRFTAMKERFEAQFKSADKNGDGSLSKEEAAQGMPMVTQHFDEIDANHDGLISRDELNAHHMAMHHGHHGGPEEPQGTQR